MRENREIWAETASGELNARTETVFDAELFDESLKYIAFGSHRTFHISPGHRLISPTESIQFGIEKRSNSNCKRLAFSIE